MGKKNKWSWNYEHTRDTGRDQPDGGSDQRRGYAAFRNGKCGRLLFAGASEHLGEVKLEIGVELFEDEKEKIIDMISEMFNDIIVSSEVVTVRNTEEGKTDKEK